MEVFGKRKKKKKPHKTATTKNPGMFPFTFSAGDLARFKWKQDLRLPIGSRFTGHAGLQRLAKPAFAQSRSAQHPLHYYKKKLEIPEWASHNTATTAVGPAFCIDTTWSVCKVLFSRILARVCMFLFHWDQATDHNSFIFMKNNQTNKQANKTMKKVFSLSPLLCNTLALIFSSNPSSTSAIDANAGDLQHKWEGKQFLRKTKTSL